MARDHLQLLFPAETVSPRTLTYTGLDHTPDKNLAVGWFRSDKVVVNFEASPEDGSLGGFSLSYDLGMLCSPF